MTTDIGEHDLTAFIEEDLRIIGATLGVRNADKIATARLREKIREHAHDSQIAQTIEQLMEDKVLSVAKDITGLGEAERARRAAAPNLGDAKEVYGLIEPLVSAAIRKSGGAVLDAFEERFGNLEEMFERLLRDKPLRVETVIRNETTQTVSAPVALGLTHRTFPTLLKMLSARLNVLLVGPAGSGKTTAAEACAKALGLKFHFNGAIDTEYKLKGFIDAHGKMNRPEFREAYEHGGVYLFDELDASMPSATMAFNAALANGFCDFPDGRVNRHKDFICIAAGNTFMGGATFDYVGRYKQDAAFADRFVTLNWDYDEVLEAALCSNATWVAEIQRLRANAVKSGIKVIISPRASFNGAAMLAAGLSWEEALSCAVRKGMSNDQWSTITRR